MKASGSGRLIFFVHKDVSIQMPIRITSHNLRHLYNQPITAKYIRDFYCCEYASDEPNSLTPIPEESPVSPVSIGSDPPIATNPLPDTPAPPALVHNDETTDEATGLLLDWNE